MKKMTIIVDDNEQCSVQFGEDQDMSWFDALLMLCSTMGYLAERTAQMVTDGIKKDNPDIKKEDIMRDIKMDIADQINYCVSNVLNVLSPKDPDLQLSEVAIATCENIIIQYAAANNMDIKDALAEAEAILASSIYAAKGSGANDGLQVQEEKEG